MAEKRLGIIMHGVTGRMGANQHLARSIAAIRAQGGVVLKDGTRVMPDPILVGRRLDALQALAKAHGVERVTMDLDQALANKADTVFFDAASTQLRPTLLKRAIAAGKHVYCEKPTATNLAEAVDIYRAAKSAGVKQGVVQDKLWLPGLLKLKMLIDSGFFGRLLSVRGEFGYWVFEGDWQPAQRPSWNYRKEDGGGIILDMLCHFRCCQLFKPSSASCTPLAPSISPQRNGPSPTTCLRNSSHCALNALPQAGSSGSSFQPSKKLMG